MKEDFPALKMTSLACTKLIGNCESGAGKTSVPVSEAVPPTLPVPRVRRLAQLAVGACWSSCVLVINTVFTASVLRGNKCSASVGPAIGCPRSLETHR